MHRHPFIHPNRIAPDTWLLAGLLVLCNTHLIAGAFSAHLVFLPDRVLAGQWWRALTYPFVHLNPYHLALDAGAFWMLHGRLGSHGPLGRLAIIGVCHLFSLAAAMAATTDVYALGLSGLSGIAHGLMAHTGLTMARNPAERRAGLLCFVLVAAKSIIELATGRVFFHFGLCGTPIAACHAGGVIGGIACHIPGGRLVRRLVIDKA